MDMEYKQISVTGPLNDAFNRMKLILFSDFNIGKWFVLGFCAFLSELCGSGAGSIGGVNNIFNYKGFDSVLIPNVIDFISNHLMIIVIVFIFVVFIALSVWALLLWLSSRGKFMFLDGVVLNKAAVSEPWHRFRSLGNSLFQFRLYLVLAWSAVMLIIFLLCFLIVWPDISMKTFGVKSIIVSAIGIPIFLLLNLIFILINQAVGDFIIPVMYTRNLRAGKAIEIFRKEVLPDHTGTFLLFYLMKFLISILIGIGIMIAGCITCCLMFCITSLPYIASVLLLPVSTFFRCYSVFFLEQFGEKWSFFKNPPQAIPD